MSSGKRKIGECPGNLAFLALKVKYMSMIDE